jgi:rhodanese-related sulfurtransferase
MFHLFKRIPTISSDEMESKLTKRIQLIDVRTKSEYRMGHIPEARNVPLDSLHTFKGNKDEIVYVICQSGIRSKRAAKELSSQGYDVRNVRYGMNQWQGKIRKGNE